MDFNLTEEQQMLRDGARRFFREHYAFGQRRALLASDAGLDPACWARYAELGWLALLGVFAVGALLIYQHTLLKPNDLSRMNAAFFTTNGLISVIYLVAMFLDLHYV